MGKGKDDAPNCQQTISHDQQGSLPKLIGPDPGRDIKQPQAGGENSFEQKDLGEVEAALLLKEDHDARIKDDMDKKPGNNQPPKIVNGPQVSIGKTARENFHEDTPGLSVTFQSIRQEEMLPVQVVPAPYERSIRIILDEAESLLS